MLAEGTVFVQALSTIINKLNGRGCPEIWKIPEKAFRKAAKEKAKVEEAAKLDKELDPTAESKEIREQ